MLRRDRPPQVRRHAGRHDHAHRRARRHGRRAAAGGHDERRRRAVHRRRPVARPSAASSTATSTRSPTRSTTPIARCIAPATSGGRCRSGLVGNAAVLVPQLLELDFPADIVTDQTSAHDPLSYVPVDLTPEATAEMARTDPQELIRRSRESMAAHCRAMVGLHGQGQRGVRLRQQPAHRGQARRLRAGVRLPGLPAGLHPAAVLRGQGPVPLGGAVAATRPTSPPPTGPCSRSSPTTSALHRWIRMAGERVAFQGLPARICWLGYGERHRLGLRFNEMVRRGELKAPIVIGRDHLDSGSVASPYRETESMLDGSDAIADWPLLNALVNTSQRRHVGEHPPRRRRRHRPLDPRRHGVPRRRHRPRRREAVAGARRPTPAWASSATPTPATTGPSRSPPNAACASRCAEALTGDGATMTDAIAEPGTS